MMFIVYAKEDSKKALQFLQDNHIKFDALSAPFTEDDEKTLRDLTKKLGLK